MVKFYLDGARVKTPNRIIIRGPIFMTVSFQTDDGATYTFSAASQQMDGRSLHGGETLTAAFPIEVEKQDVREVLKGRNDCKVGITSWRLPEKSATRPDGGWSTYGLDDQ